MTIPVSVNSDTVRLALPALAVMGAVTLFWTRPRNRHLAWSRYGTHVLERHLGKRKDCELCQMRKILR